MCARWKDKGVYDILVECAELSLDVSENAGLSNSDERITSDSLPQLSHGTVVVSDQYSCCMLGPLPTLFGDCLQAGRQVLYVTDHPGLTQLSILLG